MENNNNILDKKKLAAYTQTLLDSFLTVNKPRKAKTGQRIKLIKDNTRMCFFLTSGNCFVKRNNDSMIIASIEAPSIIGISNFFVTPTDIMSPPHEQVVALDIIIQSRNEIEYLLLPLDECLLHIETHNLWKQLAYNIMFKAMILNNYIQTNTSISTYELICNLLRALNDEDFETRATISAVKYIMERTSLSRSIIMKILSELNTGGYIVINRGLLIKIINLPEKY